MIKNKQNNVFAFDRRTKPILYFGNKYKKQNENVNILKTIYGFSVACAMQVCVYRIMYQLFLFLWTVKIKTTINNNKNMLSQQIHYLTNFHTINVYIESLVNTKRPKINLCACLDVEHKNECLQPERNFLFVVLSPSFHIHQRKIVFLFFQQVRTKNK